MRLLLDTHIFLWFIAADPQLPIVLRDAVRDPVNTVYLSVVSIWEAVIKHQLGKLPFPLPPDVYLPAQRRAHQIASLAVDEGSVAQVARLPFLHRDPFARLLIAQAQYHQLSLVTVDAAVRVYPGLSIL